MRIQGSVSDAKEEPQGGDGRETGLRDRGGKLEKLSL